MPDLVINTVRFEDVNLQDPFFDSLKESYTEFSEWFERKKNEEAFVSYKGDGTIQGFLYLKVENGPISDINPPLNVQRCLKVGTFKIDAHGTRLGERFVKIISDTILRNDLRLAYLTIFPQHIPLINILERFGFKQYGTKTTNNGDEIVYYDSRGFWYL